MTHAAGIALLLALYVALALLPLALAAAQGLPRRPWLDELSSGLAMAGFSILLLEFALSGRSRRLSERIGMDLTMRFHQFMALAALAFVMVHPFLYIPAFSERPAYGAASASRVLLTPAAAVTGMLAWILLAMLIAFAWFRTQLRWSYELWRLSHGLGALAIAALGAHHTLDIGRYAQHAWLHGFWLAAWAAALAALAVIYLVKPALQSRRRWRVANVAPEAERLWRVVLEPEGESDFRFAAGQFVWVKLRRALGRITEHPFSIASAPGQLPRLQFLVKEAGDFTRDIGRVAPGTAAYVDGPYGNFTLAGREGAGIMLIGGGAGIAPVLSLARDLAATHDPRPLKIVYADRSAAQLAARAELEVMARAPGRELHFVVAEPPADWRGLTGWLDLANLRKCVPRSGAADWLYFVCGPPGMIDAVEMGLAELGVPLAQITSERFVYDTGIATPRERLTRAVIAAVVAAQLAAVIAFVLR
ncbi:MAG TPA: ferredoxin reductase family protein [Burkholderiales bacterium]|nr:ferredoxin reductase family protein [Burkholderiales bacterium]